MERTIDPPLDARKLRALDLLKRGRRFVLSGHMRPDGDCIGAQAALARILEASGKEVWILNPDPPEPRFDYLASHVDYQTYTGGELVEHDVSVLCDFSDFGRLGQLEGPMRAHDSKKLVIDHHLHEGESWWDEAYVDTTASATGLLIYRIGRALGTELDPIAARGIFTSLVTDTGWFKYSNTDAETLMVAGEMVQHGVDPSRLYASLFQRRSVRHADYVRRLLDGAEFLADGRLAVIQESKKDSTEDPNVDSDEVLDILRSVGTVEVVLFLREVEGGACKLSARSKQDYDVNALARRFGGGGHKKASGATILGDLGTVREKVVAAALSGFEEGDSALR